MRKRLDERFVVDAHQLALRSRGVRERAEDVEDRPDAELAAHRRDVLHRNMVVLREEEADVYLLQQLRAALRRNRDVHAERLKHVRGSALRRGGAVSVLRDRDAARRRDERRRRRDVEGVRVVSAGADYFERVYVVQQPDAVLAHADRRGGYLVRRLALQRKRRQVGRHLHAARLPVHYLVHDLARLREGQVLFLRKLYYSLFNHLYFLPAFAASIKFFTIAAPSGVITDSGWNCTPQTSRRTSSSAIISPSSARAVTRSGGRQALLDGRERMVARRGKSALHIPEEDALASSEIFDTLPCMSVLA